MTAPALPATTVPVPPTSDPVDAMEQTIRATLETVPKDEVPPVTAAPVSAEAAPSPVVRDDGAQWNDAAKRWTKDGQFVAGEAPVIQSPPPVVAATGAQQPTGEAQAPKIPDGYVAPPALAEDKAKGFKVFDADGEIVAPDLQWQLAVNNGKGQTEVRSLSTDTLMNYAQMGVYNHQRELARQDTEQRAQGLEQRSRQLEQLIQEHEQHAEQLMRDPDYLVRAIADYEAQNTPEARAKALETQLEQERQQGQRRQYAQQADTFVNADLAPALDQIADALPTVSREELASRLFLAAERYRVQGVLMPQGFDPLRQFVVHDLVPWAKQVHEERHRTQMASTPKPTAPPKPDTQQQQIDAANARAQKARRVAASALQPVTGTVPQSPAPKPVRTARDAEDAVIGGTLAALKAG